MLAFIPIALSSFFLICDILFIFKMFYIYLF